LYAWGVLVTDGVSSVWLCSIAGLLKGSRMKRDLAIQALSMAIAVKALPKGCIHHTDRRT
jgi:hypothetical protein